MILDLSLEELAGLKMAIDEHRESSQRWFLNLHKVRVKIDDIVHKVRVKPYNMPKHIKNGKTFRLYAEAYRHL
jgi:ribosomal protein L28